MDVKNNTVTTWPILATPVTSNQLESTTERQEKPKQATGESHLIKTIKTQLYSRQTSQSHSRAWRDGDGVIL